MLKKNLIGLNAVLFSIPSLSLMLSCGTQAPVQTEKAVTSWQSVVPIKAIAPLKGSIEQELWLENPSALEDAQKIEDLLAGVNLLGNINSTSQGWQIAMGKHLCTWQMESSPTQLKNQRKEICIERLSGEQNQMLETAQKRLFMHCQGDEAVLDLMLEASSLATAFHKQFAGIFTVPEAHKCGKPQRYTAFKINDWIEILVIPTKDQSFTVYSKGMALFGQSDLGFVGIEQTQLEQAKNNILAMCDDALRNEPLHEGKAVASGASKGLLADFTMLKNNFALTESPKSNKLLIVVAPMADQLDWQAQKKLSRAFTLP
jgi:hypothetical protein